MFLGKSFWVFNGPTPDNMLAYPEPQRYGIRGSEATLSEATVLGYAAHDNSNVTTLGKPLSRFTEPIFIPDDSKFFVFRVHKQILKDFEQVGLAPLYFKRDFVSSMVGADVFYYQQEVLINDIPQDATQTIYLRQEQPDWLLYLEPNARDERKRLELRAGMEGLTNVIHETLRHPGAHNEHLLALADRSFLTAPIPFKSDRQYLSEYQKALNLLYKQVWEVTGRWYPWFANCEGAQQPFPELRNAWSAFAAEPPARMKELEFGQDDYERAIFAADMSLEYSYGRLVER